MAASDPYSILRLLPLVGFFAGVERGGQLVFRPFHQLCAVLQKLIRALAKFAGFALRVVLALIRALSEELASLFAGLGSKENADERSNANAHKEITEF